MGALFVLSGAAGLALEVVWMRQLGHLVGHGALAMSVVVATYLIGMLLGAWRGGALADRVASPLRLYVGLELLIAASAVLVTVALAHPELLSQLPIVRGGSLLARCVLAFALLLVPTAAMGATTPTLTKHLEGALSMKGRAFATLYALNTLGAALGCALAGFVLIGRVGLLRTALIAALVDALVALGARSLPSRVDGPSPSPARDDGAPPRSGGFSAARIAALSGFAALLCESLWFRVLRAFVKSSTYAFSLLLTVYLVGVALGGVMVARRAARGTTWGTTARLFASLTASVVVSVAVLGRLGSISHWMRGVSAGDADLAQLALGAAVLGVPTALMGAAWPCAVEAETAGLPPTRLGAALGRLAAWNTLGGALGVLAGPLLVPALGVLGGFAVAVVCYAMTAALAARRDGALTLRGDAGFAPRVVCAAMLAFALIPRDYLRAAVTRFPRARVLEVREGRDGTAAVLHYDRETVCAASRNRCANRCPGAFSWRQLIFGTVSYASTIPPARRYMRALAHLPMLLRPDARDALLICFGTGTTAASFASHPSLRALTIVDINRDVFSLARHFAASHRDVLRDPRVRVRVDDGRHFLALSDARYDVISLEPPPPTADGAAALYSAEFYELARRRIAPGGVVAQWIPLDQQAGSLNRGMVAAITSRFRHVQLWIPSRNEGVLLASDAALPWDHAALRARWRGMPGRELAEAGFASPEALRGTLVLDDAELRAWVGDAPPLRDDLPAVSFYRAARDPVFRVDEVLSRAMPPDLRAAEFRFVTAERLAMRAWDRSIHGARAAAQALVAEARAMLPADPWWDYLGALEYGCLDLDDP